jgi:hypothetical protein
VPVKRELSVCICSVQGEGVLGIRGELSVCICSVQGEGVLGERCHTH